MKCFRCKAVNADENKFCGACGANLDLDGLVESVVQEQVEAQIASRFTKEKYASIDIADALKDRVLGWVQVLGICAAILAAILGFLGYQGVASVRSLQAGLSTELDKAKSAETDFEKGENTLDSKRAQLQSHLQQLDSQFEDISRLQTGLAGLKNTVNGLSNQYEDLQSRVQETGSRDLPKPQGVWPFHLRLAGVIGENQAAAISQTGKLIFQVTGDTGGAKFPIPQQTVSSAMQKDFNLVAGERPAFLYLLGSVVFYNGESKDYYDQFYRPYDHYPAPIFAIPGNHDGESLPKQISLAGFTRNFVAPEPRRMPEAGGLSRKAMNEPNVYWTLDAPFATIVGLYTNVPSGGVITLVQQEWLERELAMAPRDTALILALHHPPFSADQFHSGSDHMAAAIALAVNESRRVPNLVLSALVHNYQRLEVRAASNRVVPFLVAGTGGYFNLVKLLRVQGRELPPKTSFADKSGTDVRFVTGDDSHHGFLTLAVNRQSIDGVFKAVDPPNDKATEFDRFSYAAAPIFLAAGQRVSWGDAQLDSEQ